MHPSTKTVSERARQLTREFLEPHTLGFKGSSELTASGSQALNIANLELTRLALNCQQTEEKAAVVEGFSQGLAQLKWNAEDAAYLVRNLERQLLATGKQAAATPEHKQPEQQATTPRS